MKIAITIADAGMAANVGGPVELITHIVEFPTPDSLLSFFKAREENRITRTNNYTGISISLVETPNLLESK